MSSGTRTPSIFIILLGLISQTLLAENLSPTTIDRDPARTHAELELFIRGALRPRRQSFEAGCYMPYNMANGTYSLRGSVTVEGGQLVPHNSILELSCPPGYVSSKSTVNFCDDEKNDWFDELAVCQKMCKAPSSLTVEFTCSVRGDNGQISRGPCDALLPPGSTAAGKCRKGHHSMTVNRFLICIDGRWGYSMPSCKAECGKTTPLGTPNVINGSNAVRGEFPWHVAIYTQFGQEDKNLLPKYWCGGSIVSRAIVISAAHCFYNPLAGQTYAADLFTAAVGKLYSDFGHPEENMDAFIQKSAVKRIEVPEYYEGESSSFGHDLAMLILEKPFTFSNIIMPVCLNLLDKNFDEEQSSPGLEARVAGFGLTQVSGDPSDVLKTAVMPIISKSRCRSDSPEEFAKYIIWDKLCAGHTTGIGVCKGDSGGGLVVSSLEKYNPTWHLRGIVSTSPASTTNDECSTNTYSTFTRPFLHKEFIEDVIERQGCEMPSDPPNGRFVLIGLKSAAAGDGVAHKSQMTLRCDKGFAPSDNSNNLCDEFTNDWLKDFSECTSVAALTQRTKGCVVPKHPENGIFTVMNMVNKKPGDTVPSSSKISVSCLAGFTLSSGEITSVCDGNTNRWEGEIATCRSHYKIVCYFINWAWYRKGLGKYVPEDIDANLCTHLIYAYSMLDSENLVIKARDTWADYDNKMYDRLTALKKQGVKVSLALGGWEDSAGDKYSRLVNDPAARKNFVQHAVEYLEKYNFDGLDIQWNYPVCWQADCFKGPSSDKAAFAALVHELKEAFEPLGLLLSSTVAAYEPIIDAGYDVPSIAKDMDWISVVAYDYHGRWDRKTGHIAPLYYHPADGDSVYNANYTINYWIKKGAPPHKLVLGMPMYGQTFTLGTDSNTPPDQISRKDERGLNVPAIDGGKPGEYTELVGSLAYYEICDRIKNRGWKVEQDERGRMGPHAYKDDQWVSYDDKAMIRKKSEYIKSHNLGGAMVWTMDLDDYKNSCGEGAYPLLNQIREVL